MRPLALVTVTALGVLSLRRALFLAAAIPPARPEPPDPAEPVVVLLVPAHDEAPVLGRLLASIERLDWPPDRLHTVLVDDGSADGTWEVMQRWAAANDARTVRMGRQSGKARALNAALEAAPPAEIAVVCDADLRLDPGYLRNLVPAFGDPSVGAAAVFVTAANPDTSFVARYAALETWVHQLVTAAAKHRLGLNPTTFAGSAYRRSTLDAIGGFADGRAGDDVEATAALTRDGWRTRFVRHALADQVLVTRPGDYWRQHLRWGRNVLDAGLAGANGGPTPPRRQRLELLAAAIGYGDRVAFTVAVLLAAGRRISPAAPAAYALLRGAEIVVAVVKAGEARRLPAYLAAVPIVLPLDIAASIAGAVAVRSPVPPAWRGSARPPVSATLE